MTYGTGEFSGVTGDVKGDVEDDVAQIYALLSVLALKIKGQA